MMSSPSIRPRPLVHVGHHGVSICAVSTSLLFVLAFKCPGKVRVILGYTRTPHFTLTSRQCTEHPEKEAGLLKEPVQQEWISYPEAERYSGLSHTTLWRYVTSGQLKAARIGRSVRIHLPALRAFMEEKAGDGTDK
jgi:excisionase family DNA binding protein